jgi:hypothetical protein
MRESCYFKRTVNGVKKCSHPKLFSICFLCSQYLKNEGDLDEKIKFLNFVSQRNHNRFVLLISSLSLLLSIITILITIFKFLVIGS